MAGTYADQVLAQRHYGVGGGLGALAAAIASGPRLREQARREELDYRLGNQIKQAQLGKYTNENELSRRKLNAIDSLNATLSGIGLTPEQAAAAGGLIGVTGDDPNNAIQAFTRLMATQGADPQRYLNALGYDTTKISDGVAFNPMGTPDQALVTTAPGQAQIGLRNAQAASAMSDVNVDNARIGEIAARTRLLEDPNLGGTFKSSDIKLVPTADGGIQAVNVRALAQSMDGGVTAPVPGAIGKGLEPAPKAKARLDMLDSQLANMADTADRVMNAPGLDRITGLMSYFKSYPGGEAATAEATMETLKNQVAKNALQTMREMSKTGGALGNTSNADIDLLREGVENLQLAQSKEDVQAALRRLIEQTNRTRQRLRQAYVDTYGQFGVDVSDVDVGGSYNADIAVPSASAQAPRMKNPVTGEVVEFNGSEWVKVGG